MRSTVAIIIDALGYDLTSRHGFDPAGLRKRGRVKTVMGFSQAALTSIMTGLMPDEHGLWMMYSFAEKRSPFRWLKHMPGLVSTERRWVRTLLDCKIRKLMGVSAYYNLYSVPGNVMCHLDLPARKQLFSPESVPGHETILDRVISDGQPVFIRFYDTDEEIAFDDLERALTESRGRYYLLYTAGLDSVLHIHGTGGTEIAEKLRWYDERIKRILALGKDIRMIVLGDHGMCDVKGSIDMIREIESLGIMIPGDYIPFYDSTMARFKINSAKGKTALEGLLGGLSGGRVPGRDELKKLGIWFEDGRFGDLIFIADPGVIIFPGYMGSKPVAGMHGYHPDVPCMDSALFTDFDTPLDGLRLTDMADLLLPGFTGRREP